MMWEDDMLLDIAGIILTFFLSVFNFIKGNVFIGILCAITLVLFVVILIIDIKNGGEEDC